MFMQSGWCPFTMGDCICLHLSGIWGKAHHIVRCPYEREGNIHDAFTQGKNVGITQQTLTAMPLQMSQKTHMFGNVLTGYGIMFRTLAITKSLDEDEKGTSNVCAWIYTYTSILSLIHGSICLSCWHGDHLLLLLSGFSMKVYRHRLSPTGEDHHEHHPKWLCSLLALSGKVSPWRGRHPSSMRNHLLCHIDIDHLKEWWRYKSPPCNMP